MSVNITGKLCTACCIDTAGIIMCCDGAICNIHGAGIMSNVDTGVVSGTGTPESFCITAMLAVVPVRPLSGVAPLRSWAPRDTRCR